MCIVASENPPQFLYDMGVRKSLLLYPTVDGISTVPPTSHFRRFAIINTVPFLTVSLPSMWTRESIELITR